MRSAAIHAGSRAMSRPLAPTSRTAKPERDPAVDQRPPRGHVLTLARIAWISVAALAVSLFAAGLPVEFALLHDPCPTARCATGQLPPAGLRALENLGLSQDAFAAYFVAMDAVFAAVWFAVAALIFWRRSDDRMGLFASLALLTFGTVTYTFTLEALTIRYPAWDVPVSLLHFLGSATFGLFLYLFPDGRFVPRWTSWVALTWIIWQLPPYFFPGWRLDPAAWYLWAQAVVWTVALGTVLYAQAYRYRRVSSATQQQQIKLVVLGIGAALSVFIGIAMLRHHLFDVDLVINRTLVYVALTASVVFLYVLVVGTLGALLQVQGSLIVSLIGAGLAAVMFQPLREW